ncbi:hypothetical protein, partial [Serratia marcescens]|uniref:hypothetical protein n=1 Tax=Serratia marcescens TaxID=615 RepID=UPI001C68DFCD
SASGGEDAARRSAVRGGLPATPPFIALPHQPKAVLVHLVGHDGAQEGRENPPFTAMLMFAYVLLMVPLLYVIDSRLSASKLVRKATQNLIIIALTLLFFSAMTLLY